MRRGRAYFRRFFVAISTPWRCLGWALLLDLEEVYMHPGWSGDFSYSYFRQLMKTAKNHFLTHHLSSAPDILQRDGSPRLFLRHDLKISLSKALQLAEIEHEYGVHATFMVRANSPLYSLNQRNSPIQLLE